MKRHILVLAAVGLVAYLATMCAHAVTITSPDQTWPGWNLISVPAIPRNSDPLVVFGNFPVDQNPACLYRWDSPTKSFIPFDMWSPQNFRGVLLGDGYYLNSGDRKTISYDGITENYTTDMWISLPCSPDDNEDGGWTIIGNPYNVDVPWANVKVTDGTATLGMYEATSKTDPWIAPTVWWWDAQYSSLRQVQCPEFIPFYDTLWPWYGYWVESLKDNLALIFDAPI